MSIYTNFTPTVNSDNRHCFVEQEEYDDIIIGGTSRHYFIVPNEALENIITFVVYYKQSLQIVLEKDMSDEGVTVSQFDENNKKIEVCLAEYETKAYFTWNRRTTVQLKISKEDSTVLYSEPHELIVHAPLDVDI